MSCSGVGPGGPALAASATCMTQLLGRQQRRRRDTQFSENGVRGVESVVRDRRIGAGSYSPAPPAAADGGAGVAYPSACVSAEDPFEPVLATNRLQERHANSAAREGHRDGSGRTSSRFGDVADSRCDERHAVDSLGATVEGTSDGRPGVRRTNTRRRGRRASPTQARGPNSVRFEDDRSRRLATRSTARAAVTGSASNGSSGTARERPRRPERAYQRTGRRGSLGRSAGGRPARREADAVPPACPDRRVPAPDGVRVSLWRQPVEFPFAQRRRRVPESGLYRAVVRTDRLPSGRRPRWVATASAGRRWSTPGLGRWGPAAPAASTQVRPAGRGTL